MVGSAAASAEAPLRPADMSWTSRTDRVVRRAARADRTPSDGSPRAGDDLVVGDRGLAIDEVPVVLGVEDSPLDLVAGEPSDRVPRRPEAERDDLGPAVAEVAGEHPGTLVARGAAVLGHAGPLDVVDVGGAAPGGPPPAPDPGDHRGPPSFSRRRRPRRPSCAPTRRRWRRTSCSGRRHRPTAPDARPGPRRRRSAAAPGARPGPRHRPPVRWPRGRTPHWRGAPAARRSARPPCPCPPGAPRWPARATALRRPRRPGCWRSRRPHTPGPPPRQRPWAPAARTGGRRHPPLPPAGP